MIIAALVALFLVLTLVGEGTRKRWLVWICKPLASTGFIALAVYCGALGTTYGNLVLVGLALSWFGDVFLISDKTLYFRLGLVSFLLGHVAYVAAFISLGPNVVWTVEAGVVLGLVGAVVFLWLRPHLGNMKVPVLAYVVVITLMVTFAMGTYGEVDGAVRVLGAVAFYLSDLGVARDRFVSKGFVNRLVGLPLYYGGQLLLAYSVSLSM